MWLIYALLGAFGKGFTNLYRKQISDVIEADVYIWITLTFSVPLLWVITLFFDTPVYDLVLDNFLLIILNSIFWIGALVFNIFALKREQLSYISPLSAFIPILTLFLAWALLNESPPTVGLLGILVVFIGAYVTNLKSDQVKWHEPITHLIKNSGARYAMGVAICFAAVSIVTKTVTNDGFSPLSWLFVINASSWLLLIYVPAKKSKQIKKALKKHRNLLIAVTLATLFAGFFGIYSIAETEYTAYAISVRRLDILFSILLGWKVLGENNIRNKIIGGSLMTVGVVIVSVF